MESTMQNVPKEFGYRQLLIQQLDRCCFLSSNIRIALKKSGTVSRINKKNFKSAVKSLGMILKPYWSGEYTKEFRKGVKSYDDALELLGHTMTLMKSEGLLLEKEYFPGPDDAI